MEKRWKNRYIENVTRQTRRLKRQKGYLMDVFDLLRINLQLFAEGGEGDGGDGAEAGEEAPDAGETRLREMGVPDAVLKKYGAEMPKGRTQNRETVPEPETGEAEETEAEPGDAHPEETPKKPSLRQLLKDNADYNGEMQEIIRARLKGRGQAEADLATLRPMLEQMAKAMGQDPEHMDLAAIVKGYRDDDANYEKQALEMGIPVEAAKRLIQSEEEAARLKRESAENAKRTAFRAHVEKLKAEAEALKKVFPGFDLETELRNEDFVRFTAPGSRYSVEDAYHMVHWRDIETAGAAAAAKKTAEKMAGSYRANQSRPQENGSGARQASVTAFDIRNASDKQMDYLITKIKRGEQIVPGHEFD